MKWLIFVDDLIDVHLSKLQQAALLERRCIRHSHLLHIQKSVRAFVQRCDLPFNPLRRVTHWISNNFRETEQVKRCADAGIRRHWICHWIEDHVWKERQDRSIEQGSVFVQKTGLVFRGAVRPSLHRCRECSWTWTLSRGRVLVPSSSLLVYVQHREVERGAAAEGGNSWFIGSNSIPHTFQVC